MLRATPTFSITIEWENARFAELERTRRMLRALRDQLRALSPPPTPPDVNLLYDKNTIDGDLVARVVAEEFQPDTVPCRTRIIPNEGLRYYEQKNFGARQSHGEITIFLDCDVVPEPGWLAAMLESFDNPAVGAVAGATHVEYRTFYSKAFALFWFFGLREADSGLVPATFFHANNCAFRSAIFAANPFPDIPAYRGHCVILGQSLIGKGVGVYLQKKAHVSHPVPLTGWYFVARALNNGRDEVVVKGLLERRNRPPLRTVYWNLRSNVTKSIQRTLRHRRELDLSPLSAAGVCAVALAYLGIKAVGELLTHIKPTIVPRLFPV